MNTYILLKRQIEENYNQSLSIRDMRFYLLCLLALESGARASDLLKLTWDQIDTDNLIVSFRNHKSKKLQQQNITRTFVSYLNRYREVVEGQYYNNNIFYNHYKRSIMSRVTANLRTSKEFNINFHELRKEAAKNVCNQKGVVITSTFLGHSRVSTTDIYLNVSKNVYLQHMRQVTI